ncbi:hypothetical protein HK102_005385, partial [Quaeritorhiza haematococci]
SIWKKHVNHIRSLNARVLVHCGSYRSFYPLLDEAVKQGLMKSKNVIFMLLRLPEKDIEGTPFPTVPQSILA